MGIDRSSGQPDEEPDRPRGEPRPGEPADHRESVQAEPETRSRQEYYDVLASGRGYEIISFAALMAERPASERHEWQIPLSQGEVDRCGLGVIDERAKRFSAAERRIAEQLADPGPAVVSVSEGLRNLRTHSRCARERYICRVQEPGSWCGRPDGQGGSQQRQGAGPSCCSRCPRLWPDRRSSPPRHPAIQRDSAREPA
jgi:hypothetical protein